MSFTRRSARINNENELPADLAASRPGKVQTTLQPRQILRDAQDNGNPEKRPRFMKSQSSTTTGGPRRTALGDVTNRRPALGDATNRINIKKATMSSMSSSVTNAGALAKKKVIASKRSLSNINIGSRTLNTANASKRNLSNVNLSSRHASSTTSITSSLSSRSSSSIISRMSRPLPSAIPGVNTLGSLGLVEKISSTVNIISPTPEEDEHDIDSEDKHDPTACWQYAEDITKYHLETESDINAKMRAILVDWLVDVHYKYGLLPQTLHIAVLLIDHFLEKSLSVGRQRLQLIGVTAMFIASKYEEIYPRKPKISVTFPTAYQFMKRFIKASRTCDDRVEHFAHYVIDRSLQEYKLMKYMPSTIAASAVYIARTQMRDAPAWSSTLEYHSSYSERSLTPCIDELKEMIWNAHNGVGKLVKLTAARRKFSKERFMAVAAEPSPAAIRPRR
ncbi:Cyclin-like [Phytophthora cactorum]|nr:Cyclin-like [Phytophthora cactorum]